MIQIDKGVPIPPHVRGQGAPKYPWREMEIGDSFFVSDRHRRSISAAASSARQHRGHQFATRSVTENGVDGIRVWRVA